MQNRVFILILIAFFPMLSFGEKYVFTGQENVFYENPSNWYPKYPGNIIGINDEVIIQSFVNFEGFDLIIEGSLLVELGETISSSGNGILIRASGSLCNKGEIGVKYMENYGKLNNDTHAMIFTEKYYGVETVKIKGIVSFLFQAKSAEGEINIKSMVYLSPSPIEDKKLLPLPESRYRTGFYDSTIYYHKVQAASISDSEYIDLVE